MVSLSQPIRFVTVDSEHVQSVKKSMNRGRPVLVLTKRSTASGDENDMLRTLNTFPCGRSNI